MLTSTQLAREILEQGRARAEELGMGEESLQHALLWQWIEAACRKRTAADVAAELRFAADAVIDEEEGDGIPFMRP